jgi:hypothetical protein
MRVPVGLTSVPVVAEEADVFEEVQDRGHVSMVRVDVAAAAKGPVVHAKNQGVVGTFRAVVVRIVIHHRAPDRSQVVLGDVGAIQMLRSKAIWKMNKRG